MPGPTRTAEVLFSRFQAFSIDRWMWECPRCLGQSSVHVNEKPNPASLTCSVYKAHIWPMVRLGDYLPGQDEDVSIPVQVPIITRARLVLGSDQ